MKEKVAVKCKYCSHDFNVVPCRVWRSVFCSDVCRDNHRKSTLAKRERSCLRCGKVFIPRTTQIKNGQGKYCSGECGRTANFGKKQPEETVRKRTETYFARGYHLTRPKGRDHPRFKEKITTGNGYVLVTDEEGKKRAEHRLVIERRLRRKLTSNEIVHHDNRIKKDNGDCNLEVVSRSQHMKMHRAEIVKNVVGLAGSKNKASKLNEESVIDILSSGETDTILAGRYDVSKTCIYYVRHRKTWQHVSLPAHMEGIIK